MDYEVKLEIFEGPLDLLLHLIYKNEVDIFDIPIASITDQYLEYLDMMKALNINVAGDFLLLAATLLYIKSRMLLPGAEDGGEEEDPRMEITRPLLEYLQIKEAAQALDEREILERDVFGRRPSSAPDEYLREEEPQLDVSLFQLIDAFRQVLERSVPGTGLRVKFERWSVKDKTALILERLREAGMLFFSELFDQDRTLTELVVTFLALLELVHLGLVSVFQPADESDIRLIPSFRGSADDERQDA